MTSTPAPTAPRQGSRHRVRTALAAVLAISLVAAACSEDDDLTSTASTAEESPDSAVEDVAAMSAESHGPMSVDSEHITTELAAFPVTTISDADRDGLIFMREEEKLALDVYSELYEVWGLPIFDNISAAEQAHTDSVAALLDRYDIPDPAVDQPAGVFENADLQALYDDLIAQGSESITEALLVGALIEDVDIADLQARASDDPAIALVYANLEKGSRNHLRAFVGQLESRGETYTPSYITQADFDEIISTSTEQGNGHGNGQGNGHGQ